MRSGTEGRAAGGAKNDHDERQPCGHEQIADGDEQEQDDDAEDINDECEQAGRQRYSARELKKHAKVVGVGCAEEHKLDD